MASPLQKGVGARDEQPCETVGEVRGMIQVGTSENPGDQRASRSDLSGRALGFLHEVADMHALTIRSGCVRGNHYHTSSNCTRV